MTITAAQLAVKVSADTSQAQSGLGGMARLLSPGGLFAVGALGAVAAVAGIGFASVKMAGDFQESMTQLVTGAGESSSNIKQVSDGILQMAKDTGTVPDQLAQGMYLIESAGYHGAAGLSVLKAAAEGAKVGNADLATVADATTTIMTDYASAHITAAQAVNALTATVASGKTHMQDLAAAMSSALPTAAAYKVHLNDVMGALATMTAAGIPAADAATYLRQTIIGLGSPTAAAAKALQSVGLTSDEVNAEMKKSLPATLAMITDAVGKKFPAGSVAYNDAIKAIAGGSKQMQGMLALSGDHLKTFQGDVENVSGAVKKGGSSITGWSDVQSDFNQKMSVLASTVQVLMIQVGENLLPVLGNLATTLASVLTPIVMGVGGAITRVVSIGAGLIKFFQGGGVAATVAKGAIIVLGGAMAGFAASQIPKLIASLVASVTAYGAQTAAAIAATIATLAAAAPFLIVGAAIGAVVAIIILLVTHWNDVIAVLGVVKKWLGDVGTVMKALVSDSIGKLVGGIDWVMGKLGAFWSFMKQVAGYIGGGFMAAVNGIKTGFQDAFGVIAGIVKAPINAVIGALNMLIGGLDSIGFTVPSWVPLIGGDGFHFSVPKIPMLAGGGVIEKAGVAIVGEKGPEPVILPKGAQVIPNGTPVATLAQVTGGTVLPAGMNQQARGMGYGTMNGQPLQVNLYLDSKRFAQVMLQQTPGLIRQATGARAF